MKRRASVTLVPILLALGFLPVPASAVTRDDLRQGMRKLWEDHVTWTRLYIVSATADLPDKDAAARRLLQNQADIGRAIVPFYGAAAGDRLTALLKDHILIAVDIVDAARKGDAARKDEAVRRWTSNADEIAGFLSGANPGNWPLADMKKMMRDHLDLTTGAPRAASERLGCGRRGLRPGPRRDPPNGRHAERRHHPAVPGKTDLADRDRGRGVAGVRRRLHSASQALPKVTSGRRGSDRREPMPEMHQHLTVR